MIAHPINLKKYLPLSIFILLLNCCYINVSAQNRVIGIVTDSVTKEPLPFISVLVRGTAIGAMTDNSGKFSLTVPDGDQSISLKSIVYKEKIISFTNKKLINLKIQLCRTSYAMSEVVIRPKKERYKKKGNPAVDFVRRVIASKEKYDPLNKPYYHYEHYEKINIALNNFQKDKNKHLLKKYKFLTNYVDTSKLSGKPILPVSTREMLEDYYYQKYPRLEKRIVKAKKSAGIDEMLSEDGVDQFLKEVFKDVDIYDNNITLFLKRFVSPLSTGGPDFYKYYLLDTVKIGGEKCVDLGFVPFSSQSSGFTGHLYIALDSTNFVKKVSLNFPRDININFIQNMSIEQEFNRAPDGTRLLMSDDINVEFSILSKSKGFFAQRISTYANHSFDCPKDTSIFKQKENTILLDGATHKSEDYWQHNRIDSLPENKKSVDKMLVQLRKDPLYYYTEKLASILITDYIKTSPIDNKLTLGPVYNLISANTVEGVRLRLGGYTTARINDRWFANGYVAYGLKDQKMKGLAQLEYSFNKKKEQANEFPVNSIRASYNYDLDRLGQQYLYTTSDNLFLSLKRQNDNKITYQRNLELSYNREFYSQFSGGIDLRYRTEYATPYIPFIDNTTGQNFAAYSLGEAQLRLRYAPGEKYYQTLSKRRSISRDAPVFTFSHTFALKGILGSNYDYNHTEIGFQKRFWFSAYGNTNIIIKAGKVWNKVPFPLLTLPNANLSYTIQYESYPMMNALEFINDQYVSWDVNYNMNGLLFNQIPLLKYMKLREIVSFRGLYGNLSKQNDPAFSKGLYEFPTGSYKMANYPYMEAGVGVANIFNFLRVDYVWRLNYLNHPNIDKSGIRVSFDFSF
ncbi:MAG: DUF5686 family protein [Paludibacter sp.]|nr:DUF5686 family protein [Paludibacter sp.]